MNGRNTALAVPPLVRNSRRRLLSAPLLLLPLRSYGANGPIKVVGTIYPGRSTERSATYALIREVLGRQGWIEGQNIRYEHRYLNFDDKDASAIAEDLAASGVDLILASGTRKQMTAVAARVHTVPIVIGSASDLVRIGLVDSQSRPGRNVTGISMGGVEAHLKRAELLAQAVPDMRAMGVLSVDDFNGGPLMDAFRSVARRPVQLAVAPTVADIDPAVMALKRDGIDALLIMYEPLYSANASTVSGVALKYGLPTISAIPGFARFGGWIEYSLDRAKYSARAAVMVDRILKGARPADIPVERPTEFMLTLNLVTAQKLGRPFSPEWLARADAVL